MAPWRWWDGRQWTPATSPPAGAPVTRRTGRAATIENPRRRRRLAYELLIVLAVFPFPYAVSAVASLVTSLLDPHEVQARYPYVIPGQPGASLPFDVLMFLVPLAAPALVLYLLYASGEGASSIGLDKHRWRGDLALLLPVFLVAFFIPLDLFQVLLQHLHLHQYVPSTSKVPGAYGIVAVVAALQAGVVEEIVVLGYLVRRLEQRGWAAHWVVVAAVLVRVSYHLYYGVGVLAIAIWATVSVLLYLRYRRLAPFVIVHALWDLTIGLAALYGLGVALGAAAVLMPVTVAFTAVWSARVDTGG